jgi:hypothetical protein
MIYYYLICFFIVTVIIGFIVNSKTREDYVNQYSGTNNCGYDSGPMDRPKNQPSCFYYDINLQNQQLYNALDKTATNLDKEINRSLTIDNKLSTIANDYNSKLNTLMLGPIVSGIKSNLSTAAALLSSAIENNKINVNIEKIYNFNQSDMEKTVRLAIELYISDVINKLIKNANINFEESVARAITGNITNNITIPVLNQFLKKFNENSNKDILNTLRLVIQRMNVRENIQVILNNSINNDPQVSNLMKLANKIQINIGDFVYFKHKLETPINTLCADNNSQLDIIVGGKVCSVNNVNKTVRISYNYVMNPNKNERCNGNPNTPAGTIINYDNAPDGLPKWYPQATGADCGLNAPANIACAPNQWPSNTDEWIKNWIGGFDRSTNQMSCGVSPLGYKLPVDVPIVILTKNLQLLLTDCEDKILFTISNPATPTLSLSNFPALGSMSNWEMSINFNVNGRQGSWRALIGDMYNNVNKSRGWGVWVSPVNNIHFSWQSVTWDANPAFNILLNTNYNLKINKTPTSQTLSLTNLNTNISQVATNNSIKDYIMTTNGPVTIGGWINYNGEVFPGTISNITVK